MKRSTGHCPATRESCAIRAERCPALCSSARPWRRWPLLAGLSSFWIAASLAGPARPHAHNDYEHARPLLDALQHGFTSVEADIYLVDGQLLVAHERRQVQAGKTLQKLYLDPLRERVQRNRGHVFPDAPRPLAAGKPDQAAPAANLEFILLIDIKSDASQTYAVLRPMLAGYRDILTRFSDQGTFPGAISVILSGSRPVAEVQAQPERWCAIDGRPADLEIDPSVHLVPLISDSWRPAFPGFTEAGLPGPDRARLRELVRRTHGQRRLIRFWGIPDQPYGWRELQDAGVDLINTDNLAGLEAFLRPSALPKSP